MVRGNIRARRDHLRGPRATFRKAFLPRPPFDLARFDMAFQKESTASSDDTDLTNVGFELNFFRLYTEVTFILVLFFFHIGLTETESGSYTECSRTDGHIKFSDESSKHHGQFSYCTW